MDGFDGVSHQLFKLCAKLVQCEKRFDYRSLPLGPKVPLNHAPHLKFAIRSILVRRTIFEQEIEATVGTAPLQGAITQKMRSKTGISPSTPPLSRWHVDCIICLLVNEDCGPPNYRSHAWPRSEDTFRAASPRMLGAVDDANVQSAQAKSFQAAARWSVFR
jgi:hypothetical protein